MWQLHDERGFPLLVPLIVSTFFISMIIETNLKKETIFAKFLIFVRKSNFWEFYKLEFSIVTYQKHVPVYWTSRATFETQFGKRG